MDITVKDINKMTVQKLKEVLIGYQESIKGKKADLQKRLKSIIQSNETLKDDEKSAFFSPLDQSSETDDHLVKKKEDGKKPNTEDEHGKQIEQPVQDKRNEIPRIHQDEETGKSTAGGTKILKEDVVAVEKKQFDGESTVGFNDFEKVHLWKKEIELMERENNLLMRENELLKKEIELSRASSSKREIHSDEPKSFKISDVHEMIDHFDGYSFHVWSEQIKTVKRVYNITDDKMKVIVSSKLKGKAKEWFHSKPCFIEKSFDELICALSEMFDNKIDKLAIRRQLERRSWKYDESFACYYHDKIILANQLLSSNEEIIEYLIDGLNNNLLRT